MQITVQLLATYRRYLPPSAGQACSTPDGYIHDADPGATVGDLLATIPFAPNELYTFFVNGRHADPHDLLHPGDLLTIFPPAGGG